MVNTSTPILVYDHHHHFARSTPLLPWQLYCAKFGATHHPEVNGGPLVFSHVGKLEGSLFTNLHGLCNCATVGTAVSPAYRSPTWGTLLKINSNHSPVRQVPGLWCGIPRLCFAVSDRCVDPNCQDGNRC